MKAKKTSKKKALPIGITFPIANGSYETREAGEQSAADALSQLMRNVDLGLRTIYRIEAAIAKQSTSGVIGTGNAQGVWVDREYLKELETVSACQKRSESKGGALGVEISRRVDDFIRVNRPIITELANRLADVEAKLDAVAQGNITNHNRLNAVEARLKVKK